MHGDPHIRRIAAQRVAKKSWWGDADHGKRMPLDNKNRAHYRWISSVICLPIVMADHNHWRCGGLVVTRRQHATTKRFYAKSGKVVASDIFAAQLLGGSRGTRLPHA